MCGPQRYETLVILFRRWKDLNDVSLNLVNFRISEEFLRAQQVGDAFLLQYEEKNNPELLDQAAERYAFACDGFEAALAGFFQGYMRVAFRQINLPIHGDLLEERRIVKKYLKEMEVVIGRYKLGRVINASLKEAAVLTTLVEKALTPLIQGHRNCSCAHGHDSRWHKPVERYKVAA